MLYALIAAHAVLGALTTPLLRKMGARVFFVLALTPLTAAIWLTAQAPRIIGGGVSTSRPTPGSLPWAST